MSVLAYTMSGQQLVSITTDPRKKGRRTLHAGDPDAGPYESSGLDEGLTPGERWPACRGRLNTHEQQRTQVSDP